MPAMTNMLVKDDKLSEYTFIPVTDTPFPRWRTAIVGLPIDGQMRLSVEISQLKNGYYKVTRKLEVPVMENVTGGTASGYTAPPKVAHVLTDIHTTFAHIRSTSLDRVNLLRLALGIDQGASATTASGNIDQSSVVDTIAGTSTPFPSAFRDLILPF